jgi:PAS domain-containing protein
MYFSNTKIYTMKARTGVNDVRIKIPGSFNSNIYYHVIENLPAAVYTCDNDGFIQTYNKAAVALWGREPEIGKDLWCGSLKIFKPDGSIGSLPHGYHS